MALTKVDISLMDNATGFTIVTKIVTVAASKLVIDGVSQDTLTLTEGYTYKFDTSHATMSGHTVSFATAADAAGSTQYTTGVTTNGTPGNAGAYTQIVVAQSAPVLYYYCANHASMGGTTSTPAAVIANKLLAYDGSGNLPAVDGSLLTNVSTATSSASDPVVATNPSGGVGTEWHNTTSGEVYICTDATAGANVWTNVGAGSGDVYPWKFGGENYGYAAGGYQSGTTTADVIDKFSLTSDANATDVGNLTQERHNGAGATSKTYGYKGGGTAVGPLVRSDRIDKWAFASDGNATDVGNFLLGWDTCCGSSSQNHGYASGGSSYGSPANYYQDTIQKWAFASDGNATDVGNSTDGRSFASGHSSTTYGYVAGGQIDGSTWTNIIDRFAYASDGNASDWADISVARSRAVGISSATYSYSCGGWNPAQHWDIIDKFPFASQTNATDIGNLSNGPQRNGAGVSSTTHGYLCGLWGGGTIYNIIQKFSTTSDGNSSDIADLTLARYGSSGSQY